MVSHLLFESASGYAIFEVKISEDIGAKSREMQDSIKDLGKFGKMVTLQSFSPFKTAAQALENINDISEGVMNEYLHNILELNLSKPGKASKIMLGVADPLIAKSIKDSLGFSVDASDKTLDLIRGIRLHAPKLLKGLQDDDIRKAQLGLGHSYSRAKLKFNVNRIDNMIIQAIALLDQLDKDVNLFSMRIREWYGYHFPELVKLVPDNHQYAMEDLDEEKLPDLAALVGDDNTVAQNILDAARGSMGSSLSEIDMLNINAFAARVVSLSDYRKSLISYLSEKMNQVAPSLTALLGERIGARLISHAGSLTNLSKYPASTVQILGAEKALFRALKTKGNTPKYGLLYHSSFIGRAQPKHKGRISRFLANKCSIASRIDCYTDHPTPKYGEALRAQVEERLNFFETGTAPSKNADAIRRVLDELALEDDGDSEDEDEDLTKKAFTSLEAEPSKKEKKSKDKKDKKKRKLDESIDADEVSEEEPAAKKAKLSKEEKKALKKALKGEHKKAEKAEDEPSKKSKKEKKEKKKSKA
ncbi:Nop-domain-containing protein [Coprinopsis sp. MPI-PUGE-AT-0042]|nr:Nop-domain-containing protein [Coprinopsis sp. MPI-PUGE-AT-0042]